jgi:hypothetical protein
MAPRIYLANVGANSSHSYASPLFDDGRFELLPIPERPAEAGPNSVRLGRLMSWNEPGRPLRRWIPRRLWRTPAHFDPEFETLTYGDNCERAPRAAALKRIAQGDFISFIARLEHWSAGAFTGQAGFFLVGFLEVENVLPCVRAQPADGVLRRFRANAHVRKGLNDPRLWDGFWVFGGSVRSRRFRRAVPVDRDLAQAVFIASDGAPWTWGSDRSDLQVIGSYTRTCRCIIEPRSPGAAARLAALQRRIEEFNPGVDAWQPRDLRS